MDNNVSIDKTTQANSNTFSSSKKNALTSGKNNTISTSIILDTNNNQNTLEVETNMNFSDANKYMNQSISKDFLTISNQTELNRISESLKTNLDIFPSKSLSNLSGVLGATLSGLTLKSTSIDLSESLKPKWSKAQLDSLSTLSNGITANLSGLTMKPALFDISEALKTTFNKNKLDSLTTLSKVFEDHLPNLTKLSESFGLAKSFKTDWETSMLKSISDSSKIFGDSLTSTLSKNQLPNILNELTPTWQTNLTPSMNKLSNILGSNLFASMNSSDTATLSIGMQLKISDSLVSSFENITESLTEFVNSKITTEELNHFVTELKDFKESSTKEATIGDFISDYNISEQDTDIHSLNSIDDYDEERTNRLKTMSLILLTLYLFIISICNPVFDFSVENHTLNEVQSNLMDTFNNIKDYWEFLKSNIKTYTSTDSLSSDNSYASEILLAISGSLLYDFLKSFIIMIKKKIADRQLTIENFRDLNKLINETILELSDDKLDITLMREILLHNIYIVRKNNSQVRGKINGSNSAFLNKNQIVIKDKKVKKWVFILYLFEDNLERGWILSKKLMKLNLK